MCDCLLAGSTLLDPLDDSNSLSDLARSLHMVQPFPPQSASADSAHAESASTQLAAHGPLVQLMHRITKPADSQQAAAADAEAADGGVAHAEAVSHAAAVSLSQSHHVEEESEVLPANNEQASAQSTCIAEQQDHLETRLQSHGLCDTPKQAGGNAPQPSEDDISSSSAQDFFIGQG